MDLKSFLELEKRRLAEEQEHLREYNHAVNSCTSGADINTTIAPENTNICQSDGEDILSKETKDWINKQHNNNKETEDGTFIKNSPKKKNPVKDDMEQWVSDTFYSYFPGFNNEYQKRQNELQKRQRKNEENLIKHQMLNKNQQRNKKHYILEHSARSNNSSLTSNGEYESLHGAGKTDMDIINVNNPTYIDSRYSSNNLRPDSARSRLLQDLRHTNLTNLIHDSPEDIMELSRRQVEIESARKKEYQQELMQQIEEKRRSIKLLKDKEHQQEEVLTRRLQEQLKTMKLEEQLEKERIKSVKIRFDTEQKRLSREQLLAKLENDSQLISLDTHKTHTTHTMEANKENISNRQDNRVYKYFSNSEKHDYAYRNKSSTLPTEIDLELDETERAKIERECFHLSEKICPMCDEPLKELENFCLRCQNKLSFRIKLPLPTKTTIKPVDCQQKSKSSEDNNNNDDNFTKMEIVQDRSFFLVCIRCEHLYSWCKTCTIKSDLCRACQNKRNLCMACRKTLCSFCLEEVACGKDSEHLHVNDRKGALENIPTIKDDDHLSELSFQLNSNNKESFKNDNNCSNMSSMAAKYSSLNNLDYKNDPPYSINIEKNSIFHPDNEPFSLFSPNKNLRTLGDNEKKSNDYNIEQLRRDTDKRLSLYMKNYGDLAYQTRGTQTTPTTSGRRDIVLQGEHNLSNPLLREMPKMTRKETKKLKGNSKDMQNLQRRWDIPAVQKYTISPSSPKVLTQVGAIKKQLQIERLFSEYTES